MLYSIYLNGPDIVSYTQRRKRTVFYLFVKRWLHYFYLTCLHMFLVTNPAIIEAAAKMIEVA